MAPLQPTQTPRLRLWGVPMLRPADGGDAAPFGPERRFQLLVLLALQAGRWVDRDRVAALLWPEHPLGTARRNLRKVVFRAHAVPGVDGLEATDHALRWKVSTDLQAFDEALRRGDAESALAWRRGVAVEGIDDPANGPLSELFAAERARLQQAWLEAALAQVRAATDHEARVRAARRVLAVDALDEAAMLALLEAERALGREAEVQTEYRRYAARLAEALGVEPSRVLRDLVHAAPAAGPVGAPVLPAGDGFIGRRLEIAEALALLASPGLRALTLLGPGGIGKSRLARQLLPACAPRFPAGVHWVELQDVDTAPAALARVAQALGIRLVDGDDAVDQLLRHLPPPRRLLVLDNVEHLPALVPALQRLIDRAPALVLLLSSRLRLALGDEPALVLQGLAVPDEDSRDFEAASSFDAVRLFEHHALAVQRDFRLESQLRPVIDIVEAVGGLPLAIELAAGWVRLLPPEQVAQDLRGSIELLERDPAGRQRPARPEHGSLRAVLDGTWRLLGAHEREALATLAVFEGGFTRAAALAVAGCSLPLLSSLVDKGLLAADPGGRFAMHPVVRAYALERLAADAASRASVVTRHAEHHARWLAGLARHARGDVALLLAELAAEQSNAVAAWNAARSLERDDLLADMVRALWAYFENLGRHREGVDLLAPALARPLRGEVAALAHARLAHGLALLHLRLGEHAQSLAIARSSIDPAEHCGDTEAFVGCLLCAGSSLWQLRDEGAARQQYEHAVAVARRRGDGHCLGQALGNLAQLLVAQGELPAGEAALREALDHSRAVGDLYAVVTQLLALGQLEGARSNAEQACRHLLEAKQTAEAHGLPLLQAYATLNLGHQYRNQGASEPARKAYQQVLALSPRAGANVLRWTAELALARMDVNDRDLAAALPRLRSVVAEARPRSATWHLVWAVVIHGHWHAAAGDTAAAARAFTAARAARWLEEPHDRVLAQLLAAMPAAALPVRAPTLDEALDDLLGDRRPPGNGEETPPA